MFLAFCLSNEFEEPEHLLSKEFSAATWKACIVVAAQPERGQPEFIIPAVVQAAL